MKDHSKSAAASLKMDANRNHRPATAQKDPRNSKSRQLPQIEWLKVTKFEKSGGYLSKWGGGNEKSRGRAEKLGDNLSKWGGWSRKWGANRKHRPAADKKVSHTTQNRASSNKSPVLLTRTTTFKTTTTLFSKKISITSI